MLIRLGNLRENHVHTLADITLSLERHKIVECASFRKVDVKIPITVFGAIADVLDEENDQHIVLVLARVHSAAQFVASLPKLGVKLRFLDRHFTVLHSC